MDPVPLLTFFVPCLNEEGLVCKTLDTIRVVMAERGHPYAVIVVDDASTDGTADEVVAYQKKYPAMQITLLRNRFTRGLGRNYFIAAQHARSEYFMIVSGDACEPPEMVNAIVSRLGQADAIIPYFGREGESRTWGRRATSRVFTFLVNLLGGHHLRYYNGPVLHKTENVRMWFSETSGFGYQAELLCRLLDEGISYIEVQVKNSDRERGVTKAFRPGNIIAVGNSLLHIFMRRLQQAIIRRRGEWHGRRTRKPRRDA